MRIEPINIIRIPGKTAAGDAFRNIQKGSELPARIIERIGGKEAILEIAGTRIRAEFMKGLPAGSSVTLKLSDVKNNTYMFSMVDPSGRDALTKQVQELTIFPFQQIRNSLLHAVGTALARTPAGILELNALLLGIKPKLLKEEDGIARILNRLLKGGVSRKTLSALSFLLPGAGFDRDALRTFLSLLGPDGGMFNTWTSAGKEAIASSIADMMREIENLPDEGLRREIVGRLIAHFAETDEAPSGYRSGEFAFWNGEEYSPVRYLGAGESWVFSVDFSNIGRTDLLAKKETTGYSVSVFSETEEASAALRESSGQLMKILADSPGGIYINFHITRQAINKIVEIYSHYSLNSVFDAKA
jgi:hypothetical protein